MIRKTASSWSYWWRVWKSLARVSLIRDMEFRTNFYAGLLRQLLWLFSFILFIDIVFQNTDSLTGWSQSEVLIILALSRFIEGIAETLYGENILEIPSVINEGRLDYHLAKPVPGLLFVTFHRFRYTNLGNALAGVILLLYVGTQGALPSLSEWPVFLLLAILGLSVYYGILVIIMTTAFYAESFQAFRAISRIISEPFTVPFDVFPSVARNILTYLFPLAFVVFVPAQALTGRLTWWQVPTAISITGIFLLLANILWRAGLRRYSSASS